MNIKIIQYELSAYHSQLLSGSDEEEISGVRVLPDDFRQLSFSAAADLLYIATDQTAFRDLKASSICNLVYLIKDAGQIDENISNGMNVILIPLKEENRNDLTLSVFNTITHILQDNERYNKCTDIIFKSNLLLSKQHYHIDEVADVIYEILGNPFSLCNSEGVFLASKYLFDIDAKFTEVLKNIKSFPLPATFKQVNSVVDVSEEPVIFEDFMGYPIRNAVHKVTIDNKEVAYMLIVEHSKRISDLDIVLMKMICCWLSYEFKKDMNFLYPQKAAAVNTLLGLLKGRKGEYEGMSAQDLRMGEGRYNYLFVMDFHKTSYEINSPHALAATAEEQVPGSIGMLFEDSIVLYLNTDTEDTVNEDLTEKLTAFSERYNILTGISSSFQLMNDASIALRQARGAISAGRELYPKKRVFSYADYALFSFVNSLSSKEDPTGFCHPKLMELIRYDKEHGTEYTYTTYILMMAGGKQVEAAKRLNIHRSTMLYRMEKIMEITGGINLYDTYIVTMLFLSYKILIQTGELDPDLYS